jgi:hypothetical protein
MMVASNQKESQKTSLLSTSQMEFHPDMVTENNTCAARALDGLENAPAVGSTQMALWTLFAMFMTLAIAVLLQWKRSRRGAQKPETVETWVDMPMDPVSWTLTGDVRWVSECHDQVATACPMMPAPLTRLIVGYVPAPKMGDGMAVIHMSTGGVRWMCPFTAGVTDIASVATVASAAHLVPDIHPIVSGEAVFACAAGAEGDIDMNTLAAWRPNKPRWTPLTDSDTFPRAQPSQTTRLFWTHEHGAEMVCVFGGVPLLFAARHNLGATPLRFVWSHASIQPYTRDHGELHIHATAIDGSDLVCVVSEPEAVGQDTLSGMWLARLRRDATGLFLHGRDHLVPLDVLPGGSIPGSRILGDVWLKSVACCVVPVSHVQSVQDQKKKGRWASTTAKSGPKRCIVVCHTTRFQDEVVVWTQTNHISTGNREQRFRPFHIGARNLENDALALRLVSGNLFLFVHFPLPRGGTWVMRWVTTSVSWTPFAHCGSGMRLV